MPFSAGQLIAGRCDERAARDSAVLPADLLLVEVGRAWSARGARTLSDSGIRSGMASGAPGSSLPTAGVVVASGGPTAVATDEVA